MAIYDSSDMDNYNGIVSIRTSGHDDQFLTLMKCYNVKTALHQVYTLVQHFSNNYIYRS